MRLKRGLRGLISLVFFFMASSLLYAGSYWWERSDEGWFFYKDPPKEEEKKEEIKEVKTIEIPETLPEPLFTERMKRWGEELLSRAMENPTIENVKAYMQYNNLMMRLSENFSLAWQKVLMMYPELESPVPVSDADKDLYFEAEREREREIIYELSKRAGLFFFYDGSCPYCERQAYYLNRFRLEYPFFVIKPVTLDGSVYPEFPDTLMDNGISQRLGVTTVPSIFLAFPPDRFERISTGLVTTGELKRRLIWYAREIDTSFYSSFINR
jgi:conjugal transfer pilus assembly protein TraF